MGPMSNPAAATLPAPAGRWKRGHFFLVLVFLISATLMLAGTRGDLAIDEVISLFKSMASDHWYEIITTIQNDNNHILNTFFLYLLGSQKHLFVYRLPAVISGIGLLVMLMVTARRYGKDVPAWTLCLAGFSYPIILYSSEARGYAPAMFFAVAAFELLVRCREQFSVAKLLLFWACMCLGFLSHFSFIMVCIALGIWTLSCDGLDKVPLRQWLFNAVKYFAVPGLFVAGLYLIYIRHMAILGGNVESWWIAIAGATSYALGFANDPGLRFISVSCATIAAGVGVWILYRHNRREWIFFTLILLVSPALVLMAWRPKILYFRYFIVCIPFFYLLLAFVLAGWFRTPGKLKMLAVLLVLTMATGHLFKIYSLLSLGRGNYRQALTDIAHATAGPVISISSDHDFRNGILVTYYARFVPPSKQVVYVPHDYRDKAKPEWVILHSLDETAVAFPDLEVGQIGKYILFNSYPYCGSSGWSWFVYHRAAEAADPSAKAAPTK